MSASLAIKGIGDWLVVSIPQGEWAIVLPELMQGLDERRDFFKGARIALQLEDRELGTPELSALNEELEEREISLWALLSTHEGTRAAAMELGLQTEISAARRRQERDQVSDEAELLGDEAVLMPRTLRSGQRLHHPGHVIVLGDVNPGAEIVAGGHILVWGKLRGTVHAGAAGDETALVCALDLMPTQLRIAGHVAVSPKRRGKARPEVVRLSQGQLVAEPMDGIASRKAH